MKRLIAFLLVLVALFATAPSINFAQVPSNTGIYTVKEGDNGWNLARQYYDNPLIWQRIVDMNVFLQEPGRVFEKDGKIILLLKPGETLVGLEKLNVAPPTAVPIAELVAPTPAVQTGAVSQAGWPWWMWALLALITLGFVLLAYYSMQQRRRMMREHELRRDPITSGPPLVPGGIPATDASRLTNFFDQQAVNRYAERNPTVDRATIRATRIGPITEGTITGEGMVGYLGGDLRPRRIEQPLAAYQARYRFPDGTEENMVTLQACMNPVTYGGDTYRGFTFTPRSAAVAAPEPERPAPQPAPHPAMAVRAIQAAAQREGRNTVTIGDDVMEFPRGYHVVVDRETGEITLNATAFEMKVSPKRIKRTRLETTRATGTSDT
jgi:hypothetical protein